MNFSTSPISTMSCVSAKARRDFNDHRDAPAQLGERSRSSA
jgi:hypothetical protein